jgi:N-methylhydantoinase A/oxoprolinase/acetone carboxylase beta subunit
VACGPPAKITGRVWIQAAAGSRPPGGWGAICGAATGPTARTRTVTISVAAPQIAPQPAGGRDPAAAWIHTRPVIFAGGPQATPFYRAEALQPGNQLDGPAVVVRADTTILILPGATARVDEFANLLIQVSNAP